MRLLNARTLQFREFFDAHLPPYAIVSHRWGPDEVPYQDFLAGIDNPDSTGYNKIVRACSWALAHQLDWLWIDTCCIDKRSSAELTEAINSMYAWYQRSADCVAYLEDVPTGLTDDESLRDAIRGSAWFTRGWTLQELLAPATVKFVNHDWNLIGTKAELADMIMEITGIQTRILCDTGLLSQASTATKMSWVANRQTTRLEDIAYCMLGIFDVNMPLLYGEGTKAFFRLQQQIIANSDDESIFAWTSESSDVGGMLADSPQHFANSGNIMAFSVRPEERLPYKWTNKGLELHLNEGDALLNAEHFGFFNYNPFGRDEVAVTLGCWRCNDNASTETSSKVRLSKLIRDKVVKIQLKRQGATWQRVRCNELLLAKQFDGGYQVPGMPVMRRQYFVSQKPLEITHQKHTLPGAPLQGIVVAMGKSYYDWAHDTIAPYFDTELSGLEKVTTSTKALLYAPVLRQMAKAGLGFASLPEPLKEATKVVQDAYVEKHALDTGDKEQLKQQLLTFVEGL